MLITSTKSRKRSLITGNIVYTYLEEHYALTEEEIKEVMDGYDPSDKDNQSNLERMMQERAFSHLTE